MRTLRLFLSPLALLTSHSDRLQFSNFPVELRRRDHFRPTKPRRPFSEESICFGASGVTQGCLQAPLFSRTARSSSNRRDINRRRIVKVPLLSLRRRTRNFGSKKYNSVCQEVDAQQALVGEEHASQMTDHSIYRSRGRPWKTKTTEFKWGLIK